VSPGGVRSTSVTTGRKSAAGVGDEPQRMHAEVTQRRRVVGGHDTGGANQQEPPTSRHGGACRSWQMGKPVAQRLHMEWHMTLLVSQDLIGDVGERRIGAPVAQRPEVTQRHDLSHHQRHQLQPSRSRS
jgi:hypothetical protein